MSDARIDSLNSWGLTQSLIDMVGFFGGNYVANEVASAVPKVGLGKTLIFGISDLLVRNGTVDWLKAEKFFEKGKGNIGTNMYIAFIAFLAMSGADILKGKELGNSIYNNLFHNAIGFGTNEVIDRIIPAKYM